MRPLRTRGVRIAVLISTALLSSCTAEAAPTTTPPTTAVTTTTATSSPTATIPDATTTTLPAVQAAVPHGAYEATIVAADGREVPTDPRVRAYEFSRQCDDCPITGEFETAIHPASATVEQGNAEIAWAVDLSQEATNDAGEVVCRWEGLYEVAITPVAAEMLDGSWVMTAGAGTGRARWDVTFVADGVTCEPIADQLDSVEITRS